MRKCTQLFANGADVPPTTVVPLLLELGRQGASFFDVGPAAKNYKRAIHVAGKLHKTHPHDPLTKALVLRAAGARVVLAVLQTMSGDPTAGAKTMRGVMEAGRTVWPTTRPS